MIATVSAESIRARAVIDAIYAKQEPHRRRCEARYWLSQGTDTLAPGALHQRVAKRRGQAAADQLYDDMRTIQRARRYLHEGCSNQEAVDELRRRLTPNEGKEAVEYLVQVMRAEWAARRDWW